MVIATVELTHENLEVPDGPYRGILFRSDKVLMSQEFSPDIHLIVQVMETLEKGLLQGQFRKHIDLNLQSE